MIKANFNTYSNYVSDSVYQWDLNRVLTITGLNLASVPEIHFSNANMERAIVRQATMVDFIVSVGIPNSLLQSPLPIRADIGIYEGDTFKVVETVTIPVIAKTRPADYRIEDSDEEIYSFNALENLVNNALDAMNETKTELETSKQTYEEAKRAYEVSKSFLEDFSEDSDTILEIVQGKANKTEVVEGVLAVAGWSGDTYSFENTYPSDTYDIEIALNNIASSYQVGLFNSAQIVGSATTNVVKAFGTVPTADIPIIIRRVRK